MNVPVGQGGQVAEVLLNGQLVKIAEEFKTLGSVFQSKVDVDADVSLTELGQDRSSGDKLVGSFVIDECP